MKYLKNRKEGNVKTNMSGMRERTREEKQLGFKKTGQTSKYEGKTISFQRGTVVSELMKSPVSCVPFGPCTGVHSSEYGIWQVFQCVSQILLSCLIGWTPRQIVRWRVGTYLGCRSPPPGRRGSEGSG
jgi:hypothetical protein